MKSSKSNSKVSVITKFSLMLLRYNASFNVTHLSTSAIESDTRPIIFFKILLWPKNLHLFGLDLKKLV
jgi:hypothetical protein